MSDYAIVPAQEMKRIVSSGATILDVRRPEEHADQHIVAPHIFMPLDQLDPTDFMLRHGLDKEAPVYILCRSGMRARKAADMFAGAGYKNIFVIEGGILACAENGEPVAGTGCSGHGSGLFFPDNGGLRVMITPVPAKPDVRGFFDPDTATWTYVVWAEGAADKKCAVIDSVLDYDPASGRTSTASADKVIYFIRNKGLQVEWILETHIHADHLTASHYLKEKLGGKTAMSAHIVDVLKTWQPIFHNENDTPMDGSQFDHLFRDDEKFSIGTLQAQIMHTPGHTPADAAYVIGDAVFVGDAMFLPDVGTGRCDFPGGSAVDSYNSTRKLLALPDNYRMYVGHDYPDGKNRAAQCMAFIGEQKASNILAAAAAEKDSFVKNRIESDKSKRVPELLLPSLQVNLRAGGLGAATGGVHYIKIPLNTV